MTTQSASQKAALNEYRVRTHKNQQLPIDIHYDQWNRFENFLKFASKKEIRDRLRELDPPPMSNYVDPDVIDNIKNMAKPPMIQKKPQNSGLSAKEENKLRVDKMKQIYGLYKKFQE